MFERVRALFGRINAIFIATVIIPTTVSILYFGIFSSDVFVSESKFVVRSPEKPSTTGIGLLLKSAGFANAGEEIFAAQDYVSSRDALAAINKGDAFKNSYGNPDISMFDRFDPFGWDGSFEELYKYFGKKVSVEHDTTSSVTTLTVRAYTPQQAQKINHQLLMLAEGLVNRLNDRGRQDLIKFASVEVFQAKNNARAAAAALAEYRNREGVVDPEKEATVQLQMVSKLQDKLIADKTQLHQLRNFTPQNPQIPVLESGIRKLEQEMKEEVQKVSGGSRSLAKTAAQYQRLQLDNQFAERQLASAMTSLEDAKNEARRKQAYVEFIVQPNLPDEALEPRRLRGVLATLAMGLVAWAIATMLLAGVREHQD